MSPPAPPSLLLVDDEEANRMILGRRLEREGCRVTAAENGARALELLRGGSLDLVLLDLYMPDMDGLATLDAIKSDAMLRDIPVVMLTAETAPESVALCLGHGAADYLAKPVSPETLRQCLRRHVGRAGPVPEPAPGEALGPQPGGAPDGVIDWTALRAQFNDREDFIRRLVAAVRSSHGDSPARLRQAAASGDLEGLAFLAHTLKGIGGNMKARQLQELGGRTETSARAGQAEAAPLAGQLAQALEALLAALERWARDHPG